MALRIDAWWTGSRPARGRSSPAFWLPTTSPCSDPRDEACALFERLLTLRNDIGLLSEEYDPAQQRLVGNFPQAFTHVALIRPSA